MADSAKIVIVGTKHSAAAAAAAVAVAAAKQAKGPKRRRNERNILTFYEKIAVIRYYDETNISRNSLAKMFHCCATQIRRILERKADLLQQLATLSETDASIILEEMTRKRRKFEMSAISYILHQWVERCRQLRLRMSITNQTLKETALKMAAVLNLPAFRPSYRWLNRFRDKYKYDEQDLGCTDANAVTAELAVEDIIIEFKDTLPSFMQKEITSITATASTVKEVQPQKLTTDLICISNDNSHDSVEISDDDMDEMTSLAPTTTTPTNANNNKDVDDAADCLPEKSLDESSTDALPDIAELAEMNAGTCTLLNSVFPHLAVIHQFALMNSDVKALELISQLGVHMQLQATSGAYKQLSLATNTQQQQFERDQHVTNLSGGIYADIDDIELIE